MPAKPRWYSRINDIVKEIQSLSRSFVDRATIEFLLGIGRRRAQQIMSPCITDRVGTNGLADREGLIAHLRHLAEGDDAYYERQRRRKVAQTLAELHKEQLERPPLLVEAPVQVLTQEFDNLPEGIRLEPGRITVIFDRPQEALEKLLALAMAIRNDLDLFESSTRQPTGTAPPG